MDSWIDLCEKLSERYGIQISPKAVESSDFEQRQTLGQLFLKSDCLFRLRKQFETAFGAGSLPAAMRSEKFAFKMTELDSSELEEYLFSKHPHLKLINEIFGNEISSEFLAKIIQLAKAFEVTEEESEFLFQEIVDKIKEKSLDYLKQKLELERVIATNQRILLLIADKQQIIKSVKSINSTGKGNNSESPNESFERNFGELKEKELLNLIETTKKYRKEIATEKQLLSKQLTLSPEISEEEKDFFNDEINLLYNEYLKSEEDLDQHREMLSKFLGLPADLNSAKIRVAQAQANLIKKQEELERVIYSN